LHGQGMTRALAMILAWSVRVSIVLIARVVAVAIG
jgi:hypothetical protein